MAKYQHVVKQVQEMIADRRLKPGDPLPSERQLAQQLGVASGTVRLAYDYLFRTGVIDRHQGRGTFVADPLRTSADKGNRRLGLLAVEMRGYESPYLRSVIFELQRVARSAGYELIVDQLDMEDLVAGKMPEMIRRRSVDGFFTYGRVREHHIHFLDGQPLPFIQIGNRPVPASIPQVTIDADGLSYEFTRELIRIGRDPIWIDVDPANVSYETGQQMLKGYARAMQEHGRGAQMRLCHLNMDRIDDVVSQLMDAEQSLDHAAYIVQNWSASLLMPTLSLRTDKAERLLLAPLPSMELCELLRGPNVLRWDRMLMPRDLVVPSVEQMLAVLEGRQKSLRSVELMLTCRVEAVKPSVRMSLSVKPRAYDPQTSPAPARPALSPVGGWMI